MYYEKGICPVINAEVKLGATYKPRSIRDKNGKLCNILIFCRVEDFPCEIDCGSLTKYCPIYKKFPKKLPYS